MPTRGDAVLARALMSSGCPGVSVLVVTQPVWHGDSVSLGIQTYVCDDQWPPSAGNAHVVPVPVFMGYATGVLYLDDSATLLDGHTVTVGGKTYTFRDTLTGADGEVKLGGSVARCFYNLAAAMNVGVSPSELGIGSVNEPPLTNDLGEGAGVAYSSGMTANPGGVMAQYGGDNDFNVSHRRGGTAGNSVDTSCWLPGTSAWLNGATLDPVDPPSADAFLIALEAVVNGLSDAMVFAERLSMTELLLYGRGSGGTAVHLAASFTDDSNHFVTEWLEGAQGSRSWLQFFGGATREVQGWEQDLGKMFIVFGNAPRGAMIQVYGSGGDVLPFDGRMEITGRRVTVFGSGVIPLVAGTLVRVIAY